MHVSRNWTRQLSLSSSCASCSSCPLSVLLHSVYKAIQIYDSDFVVTIFHTEACLLAGLRGWRGVRMSVSYPI